MRDLLMLGVLLVMLVMAFRSGFVAFLLWVFATVLSPQLYLYGFMQEFRFVFVFAGIALVMLWMEKDKDRGQFAPDATAVVMVLFVFHAILTAIFSMQPNPAVWFRLDIFLKGIVLAFMAPFFLTSRWRIHVMLIVLVMGLGFHGVLDGLKMISSGGGHNVTGIPTSSLTDNNLYALGMVMLLPLILYLAKYSGHRIARWVALIAFALCVMTVLGSNSRGGFLALAILGVWYWITSPRKLLSTVFVAIVAVGVVQFAPERWFERIETIKDAAEDQSFLGRVAAWKVSVNIANDNPLLGGGFHAGERQWIWNRYKETPNFINYEIPEMVAKAAHSNYFQVLGDMGYLGLFLFLALLGSAFVNRWRIKAAAAKTKGDTTWATDLATAINLSLVAYMAGGAGVSLAYFELVYLFIMVLPAIHRILIREGAKEKALASALQGRVAHV
ncbi:putative O-glycosylation ligase, exosortase A system-associated [Hydrogenophaga sp.]|uniref:putative O-glycosylation ligase, exosortase A system-associated n=1 Tax=Hydrogenophaga sp. TaxID=1904254 RepID=UPI003AF5A064